MSLYDGVGSHKRSGWIKIPMAWNWHRVANRLRSSCDADYCHREKNSIKSKMCQLCKRKFLQSAADSS